ncbi:MAG TPA: ricin-type beta-trefoil lectin domain protein [Gemmatimonadaceae bacterium]|nr:ricin-type beta-trefoil lectin domain protein [Gemmatimonadaceae bacterium]
MRTPLMRAMLALGIACSSLLAFGACSDSAHPSAPTAPGAVGDLALAAAGKPMHLTSQMVATQCIDGAQAGAGQPDTLQLWTCKGNESQTFTWMADGTIRAFGGTMCLDVFGNHGSDGDPVGLWMCHGGINQRWTATSNGEIRGVNGKCVDARAGSSANGTRIILWSCHGGDNQRWNTVADDATSTSGDGSTQLPRPFPASNPWNQDISAAPVDPGSSTLIASCGAGRVLHPDFGTVWNGAPNGIPYVVVHGTQAKVPVSFRYASESDPGPYPIPADAPIQGGPNATGDRHVIVIDADNWKAYELFGAYPQNGGASWTAASGAIFDLSTGALRPAGWTSADAAGLPIFPGLVRYDEAVVAGAIQHALRMSCDHTRNGYIYPARHAAGDGTSTSLPPMGMRVRLKASVDISHFSHTNQVILRALQHYGAFVADEGVGFMISGAPDSRWNDSDLHELQQITASDFEVVKMGTVTPYP